MENIDNRVRELSGEDRRRFEKALSAVLEDDMWFSLRGINYDNRMMAKIVLYNEMFEGDFSHLRRDYLN